MKRLDVGEGNYGREIEEDHDVMCAMTRLQDLVLRNEAACSAFMERFHRYSALWTRNMEDSLREWLDANSTATDGAPTPSPKASRRTQTDRDLTALRRSRRG